MPHDHDHGEGGPCRHCGQPTSQTERHVRFSWPDVLFDASQQEGGIPGLWLSHDTAEASVMMQTPDAAYVRVLLPIRLDDASNITYGVWLQVQIDVMHNAASIWTTPQYTHLRLEGHLANDVPPGQAVNAAGVAVVRDPDHTPYLDDSNHPLLNRLLAEVWPATLHA